MEYPITVEELDNNKEVTLQTSIQDSSLSSFQRLESGSFQSSICVTPSQDVIFATTAIGLSNRQAEISLICKKQAIFSFACKTKVIAKSAFYVEEHKLTSTFISVPLKELLRQESENLQVCIALNNETAILLKVSTHIINDFSREERKIASLMPSRGYFGGLSNTPLRINVQKKIDTLFLCNQDTDAYLNFSQLHIYTTGRQRLQPDQFADVTASSNVSKADLFKTISSGNGFHSRKETFPHLIVRLKKPEFVESIEIVNRRDKWGSRIQNLAASVAIENHKIVPVYSMLDFSGIEQDKDTLINLCQHLRLDYPKSKDRYAILSSVVTCFEEHLVSLKERDFDIPLQMLSTWNENYTISDNKWHKTELALLAIYIFVKTKKTLSLSLNSFSRLLSNSKDIEYLESKVNAYRSAGSLFPLKFTKHGAARQGMLVCNTDKVLLALDAVMEDLSRLGLKPCIAYGTLLGAQREGKFIDHDDDVDILIELSEEDLTESQVRTLMNDAMAKLAGSKYRVNTNKKSGTYNTHVCHRETDILIDVFPYWYSGNSINLYMEKMAIKSIPKQILSGRSKLQLYQKSYDAPFDIKAFLLSRYGPRWEISDRYHEWPWQVKQDSVGIN
ncbi:LicD family protein [Alteromonas gilva]|uniref:LicD family protein n=1 Tax=Alteromonas gilva TaxID=2987522 RepID=A0ABT5LA69_9ALTE|nr:LicD family protein [Alteromonas gilva]MDC8833018.1 LicD family protein [Alteromonas gilva]